MQKAEKQMDKLSKGLKTVDDKVSDLREQFETSTKEATQIKIDLEKEQETLGVAAQLVEGLSGEFARWNQQVSQCSSLKPLMGS